MNTSVLLAAALSHMALDLGRLSHTLNPHLIVSSPTALTTSIVSRLGWNVKRIDPKVGYADSTGDPVRTHARYAWKVKSRRWSTIESGKLY